MKRVCAMLCLFSLVIATACSKSSTTPDPATGNNFQFNSLVAADTVLKVNAITTITANATGTGLSYKWSATYGTFIGTGATVQWTVCHQANFKITCVVSDQDNHAETKSIIVRTQN